MSDAKQKLADAMLRLQTAAYGRPQDAVLVFRADLEVLLAVCAQRVKSDA